MNSYCWAVPWSSNAPHLAHLIMFAESGVSHRLCRQGVYLDARRALIVDHEYELRCKVCVRFAAKSATRVPQLNLPEYRTSRQVTEARWGMR